MRFVVIIAGFFLVIVSCGINSTNKEEINEVSVEQVTLISPSENSNYYIENRSKGIMRDVEFKWNPILNSTSYSLEITNLNTNQIISTITGISTESKKISLCGGIKYSWKVSAQSSKNNHISYSPTWIFFLPLNN